LYHTTPIQLKSAQIDSEFCFGFLIQPLRGELAVGGIQISIILDTFPFIFTAISDTPFPSIFRFPESLHSPSSPITIVILLPANFVEARVPYEPTLVGHVLHVRNPHVKRKPYSGHYGLGIR